MNRDDKNWAHFQKIKYFKYESFDKSWSPSPMFITESFFWKDSTTFQNGKMTLKIRILRSLRRLFIILVNLTVTLLTQ